MVRRARDARTHTWLTTYRLLTLAVAADPDPAAKGREAMAAVWAAEERRGEPPEVPCLEDLALERGALERYEDSEENRRLGRVGRVRWVVHAEG